jgi:hypothetical protein
MLLGEHGANETDQRGAVGEDADHVGAAPDLAIETLLGIVRPDLAPDRFGEAGEGQHVGAGVVQVLGDGGEFLGQGVQDAVELGVDGLGVGLVRRCAVGLSPSPTRSSASHS